MLRMFIRAGFPAAVSAVSQLALVRRGQSLTSAVYRKRDSQNSEVKLHCRRAPVVIRPRTDVPG